MTAAETQEQWVWLARIRRPQGRKGEVFADILTDFPEKFADRKQLWLIAEPGSPRAKTHPSPREVELTGPLAAQGRHRAALCAVRFHLRRRDSRPA